MVDGVAEDDTADTAKSVDADLDHFDCGLSSFGGRLGCCGWQEADWQAAVCFWMIVGGVLVVERVREGGKEVLSNGGGSRDLKPQRQSPKEGEGKRKGEGGRGGPRQGDKVQWEGGQSTTIGWCRCGSSGRKEGLQSISHVLWSPREAIAHQIAA